jgi:hypothetical protein
VLVVGEFVDRHYVPLITLLHHANASGLDLTTRIGPPIAYFARLRPAHMGVASRGTGGGGLVR